MKSINLVSLVEASESLSLEEFDNFKRHYGFEMRDAEIEDLKKLEESLYSTLPDLYLFNDFFVGYKIPQIGKEFDLLRVSNSVIINIELKSSSTEDKIQQQLVRNKYYLSFTGKKIYHISYVSDTNILYLLENDNTLGEMTHEQLAYLLKQQSLDFNDDINILFNPSDYLVSPFNSTDKFIEDKYFLTNQQESIKTKIITRLNPGKKSNFISVIGNAGTGKTLLIYDIAKSLLRTGIDALIVHCGNLNPGQVTLSKSGLNIIEIKRILRTDISVYDVIIIDEAQRINPDQLDYIIKNVNKNKITCIFSYDKLQTLANEEKRRNIDGIINSINQIEVFSLSKKIRTNKEIADFIRMLFDKKRNLPLPNTGNIKINFFQDIQHASEYLSSLDETEWNVLNFTPSQYNIEYHEKYFTPYKHTSHQIIGQEFDEVAVTMDEHFTYDIDGKLAYSGSAYYNPLMMFFQNITRTRKRLNVIIIKNREILNRCLSILS